MQNIAILAPLDLPESSNQSRKASKYRGIIQSRAEVETKETDTGGFLLKLKDLPLRLREKLFLGIFEPASCL